MSQPDPENYSAQDSGSLEDYPVAPTAGNAGERPRTVTAAAVIAFILAAYEIISGILVIAAAIFAGPPSATTVILWIVMGILHVAFGALLFWGARAALRGGAGAKILVLTAAAAAAVLVIVGIVNVVNGEFPGQLVVVILYAALLFLLFRPESKQFLGRVL